MFHMNAGLVGLYYSFTDWDGMYIALYAIAAVQARAHIGHGQIDGASRGRFSRRRQTGITAGSLKG